MISLPVSTEFLVLELIGAGDFNNRVMIRLRDVSAIAENGSNCTLDIHLLGGSILRVRGTIEKLCEQVTSQILLVERIREGSDG